ncbi:BI1 inhibitor, partial [Nothocercus nigrocapillus]|nr:BI1 inhibitor [Nothocercus nigrocapillus]
GTMNVFDRNINFDALFKFSHISASTQEHLKRVYGSFALCMFVAAAGAYVNVVTQLFQVRGAGAGGQRVSGWGVVSSPRPPLAPQFSLLTGLGALGLMIWLTATPHSKETEQKRLGMLAGFAFLTGINLGPLLEMCISINPSIIPSAFLGTAAVFTCFSLSALFARRRSFLYLGGETGAPGGCRDPRGDGDVPNSPPSLLPPGFLLSGLTLMLLSSVVNAFVGSTWLFTANLYLGLMIMCGFVLFDTQLIIEKAEGGDKD